jgi:urease accessory protein
VIYRFFERPKRNHQKARELTRPTATAEAFCNVSRSRSRRLANLIAEFEIASNVRSGKNCIHPNFEFVRKAPGIEVPKACDSSHVFEMGTNRAATVKPQTVKPQTVKPLTTKPMPTIWQLLDSSFPTGSYAHSYGLEAAFQNGDVTDELTLAGFVHDTIYQTGHATLPLVTATHRHPDRLVEFDGIAHAFLTNAVANRASRAQGRTLVTTCGRVWPSAEIAAVEATVRTSYGHLAPVTGATFRALEISLRVTQQIVLFTTARNVFAAAVRLGIVGPYRAQRMQHESGTAIDAVLEQCGGFTVDQLSQTAPVLDLLHASHDRLYSRLFQS